LAGRFGEEYYSGESEKRYYYSTNMDMRFKGMAICGQVVNSIAIPSYPGKIVDPGLETWTSSSALTNWPFTGDGTCLVTRQPSFRTYMAQLTPGAGGTGNLSQTITWNANYQSKAITVKAWVSSNADGANTTTAYLDI